jgi:hypothetical protein
VYVNGNGGGTGSTFTKTGGGIIYGDTDNDPYDDNDPDNGNTTDNTAKGAYPGSGNAVYYNKDSGAYYRDTTLNTGDNISTAMLPGSGSGWTAK